MEKPKSETNLKQFIARQETIPAPEEKLQYPYSEYWIKAIVYILLSGTLLIKHDSNANNFFRRCEEYGYNLKLL